MIRAVNTFPIQKLPYSKKTDQWRRNCVDYIIGASKLSNSTITPSEDEMRCNYDLYNGIYREEDLKYVTNPFNQKDGFPAKARNYNIIRPEVDLLIGEETKRPFNFRVCRTSQEASSVLQEKAKELLIDYAMARFMADMGPEYQERFDEALASGEIVEPDGIYDFLTKDYKDVAEETAYHSLNYFREKLNLDHEFLKAWEDGLKGGVQAGYVGIEYGEPIARRVNPINLKWADSDNIEFIHEAEWCDYKMLMSPSQVYDKLGDKMTEKDLNDLLELIEGKPSASGYGPDKGKLDNWNPIRLKIYSNLPSHNPYGQLHDIVVHHTCWRSFKKIGFVTIEDPETGMPVEFEVDEYYTSTGFELNIEWKWIIEIWEGWRVGDDLYLGIQPIEYQHFGINGNSQRLPYTGVIYSRSLVEIMKPLQYQYIILWYRLELALAKDKGKIITMDPTQIPKSMGIDTAKWLHYLQSMGVMFINPYEEGWDIPGREGGKPASFNQFTEIDTSVTNQIVGYINLMNKIEDMLHRISGITPERLGNITPNQLVGNVTTSVVQSNNVTEPLFWKNSRFKREMLIMLLNTAKAAWRNSDKEYLHYIMKEGTRAFLEIDESFLYEEMDIFVTDSTEENNLIEMLHQFIQPAMQNGASLADVADILGIKNVTMIRNKLRDIENERLEREQTMREQELQLQQQLQQIQLQIKEMDAAENQADRDLQKYKIDTDNETRIVVAELNAYRGSADLDQNNNGIPDPMEIANNAIAQRKLDAEIADKQFLANIKNKELDSKKKIEDRKIQSQEASDKLKAQIEKRKIQLEEKKLRAAEKIQKQKDNAALEREKLKARTALQNKVVGEK